MSKNSHSTVSTENYLVDLINSSAEPMQFTAWFNSVERKRIRQLAVDGKVLLYKDQGVLWVKRNEPTHRTAKAIEAVTVLSLVTMPDGITVAEVPCADYIDFIRQPKAIAIDGFELGRSGFNSDRGIAYFRSDYRFALPVK